MSSSGYVAKRLFVIHRNNIQIFTPEEYTPLEFQKLITLTNHLYVSVYKDTRVRDRDTKYFGLDFSKIIRERIKFVTADTWTKFTNLLTDKLAIGYSKKGIPGFGHGEDYPTNQLITYDVMSCINEFTVNYADHSSQMENEYHYRHKLFDLAIRSNRWNLKYCLPVVNGFACFPMYISKTKTLYAVGGARLCWQQQQPITPEVVLLDFKDMNGMIVSKLYWNQTDERLVNKSRDISVYYDNNVSDHLTLREKWLFKTPYSLFKYTPVLVIAGILVFPDEYQIVSEYSFKLDIQKLPLHKAIVLKSYFEDRANSTSGITYGITENTLDYMKTAMTFPLDLSMQCFAITIKTYRVFVLRDKVDTWCHGYTINSFAQDGLLKDRKTGIINNYHLRQLNSRKELSIQNWKDLYLVDRSYDTNQVSFIDTDCKHFDDQILEHQASAIKNVENKYVPIFNRLQEVLVDLQNRLNDAIQNGSEILVEEYTTAIDKTREAIDKVKAKKREEIINLSVSSKHISGNIEKINKGTYEMVYLLGEKNYAK